MATTATTISAKEIRLRGLRLELDRARAGIENAFWQAGRAMEHSAGQNPRPSPRQVANRVIANLQQAIDYYDAVQQTIENEEESYAR